MTGNTDAQRVVAACKKVWDDHRSDCSGFVKAVATELGVSITGQANDIVAAIRSDAWEKLADGVAAKAAAEAGKLVIAGLLGKEQEKPSVHGHVVVVVGGRLAHDKYPRAYWGQLGSVGKQDTPLNFAWTVADRDKVSYGAKAIAV